MADELPAMDYQPQIEKLVTRGRKRGLAVVMGFQNVSQLRSIYGADGAITLTSSPTIKSSCAATKPRPPSGPASCSAAAKSSART